MKIKLPILDPAGNPIPGLFRMADAPAAAPPKKKPCGGCPGCPERLRVEAEKAHNTAMNNELLRKPPPNLIPNVVIPPEFVEAARAVRETAIKFGEIADIVMSWQMPIVLAIGMVGGALLVGLFVRK